MSPRAARVALAAALCVLLAGGALIGGGVTDQSGDEIPSGPFTTVAVGPNETVTDDVTATGGRVVVAGTVEGDLRAYGGVVVLTEDAVVTGDVQAFGNRVVLAGEVRGPVTAYGGTVAVTGTTESLNAGGGTVRIGGRTGDVTALGARVVLANGATVDGDFEYDARLRDRGGTVTGERRPTDALLGPVGPALRLAGWLPTFLPLPGGLLGLALARADPKTDALAARGCDEPVRTLARGIGVVLACLVGVPLVALTVVGLPLVGLLVPLAVTGGLLAVAVGTRAVGGVAGERLPISRDLAGVVTAVVAALPGVGLPVALLLVLWGAGAAVPIIRS